MGAVVISGNLLLVVFSTYVKVIKDFLFDNTAKGN